MKRSPLKRKTPLARSRPMRKRRRAKVSRPAMLGKDARVVDPEYLDWCREQPCAFCNRWIHTEAHHVLPKRMGGANLRDDLAVPACRECHMRCGRQTVVILGMQFGPIDVDEQRAAATKARAKYLAARGEQ